MPMFRKRPVVIEAERVSLLLDRGANNWMALPQWARDGYNAGALIFGSKGITVRTLEGLMEGRREDWIIKGVAGELYPCRDDIFRQTYEPEPQQQGERSGGIVPGTEGEWHSANLDGDDD